MEAPKKSSFMSCCKKPEPHHDLKSSLAVFEQIESISEDAIEAYEESKKHAQSFWKKAKKKTNPHRSFLCLGSQEIQLRYNVELDLDEVAYCKKNSLVAFTNDTCIVMLTNIEEGEDR